MSSKLVVRLALGLALAACGGRILDDADVGGIDDDRPDASALDGSGPIDGDAAPHDAALSDVASPADVDAATPVPDADVDACSAGNRFVSAVVAHEFGTGQSFNQVGGFPHVLYGPPAANDTSSVVSLGNGGWVVLAFGGNAIVDGPGPDFTVFENPLPQFKELATVAVSDDGITWTSFPCTWQRGDVDYGSCAGVNVVLSSPTNGVDSTDPAVSGGDSFDLATIGVAHARFVRITDRVDLDGMDGVFDLDAVAIVHGECP